MSTGTDHFRVASNLAHEALNTDTNTGAGYEKSRRLAAIGQIHATLALTAATALQAVLPVMGGDSAEVTDWARLIAPDLTKTAPAGPSPASAWPENWPPLHGDIWADHAGHHWCCQADTTLACMTYTASGSAEWAQRTHGPIRLVRRTESPEEEPF